MLPADIIRIYFRYPPAIGGMETHIKELSEYQRSTGLNVINVYSIGPESETAVRVLADGLFIRIKPAFIRNLLFYACASTRVRRRFDLKGAVVHVHGDWSDFLLARLFFFKSQPRKYVASIHGSLTAISRRLIYVALKNYSAVFTTGPKTYQLLKDWTIPNLTLQPSGVRDHFFLPSIQVRPAASYDIVFVGHFSKKKGIDTVLEIALRSPEWRFALVGVRDALSNTQRKLLSKKLPNVKLYKSLVSTELISVLNVSSVFFLPSREEGTPTALLEAMAVSLPVLVGPCGEFDFLFDIDTEAQSCRNDCVSEYMSKLTCLLSDQKMASAIGRRNRQRAANYSWEIVAKNITELTLSGS